MMKDIRITVMHLGESVEVSGSSHLYELLEGGAVIKRVVVVDKDTSDCVYDYCLIGPSAIKAFDEKLDLYSPAHTIAPISMPTIPFYPTPNAASPTTPLERAADWLNKHADKIFPADDDSKDNLSMSSKSPLTDILKKQEEANKVVQSITGILADPDFHWWTQGGPCGTEDKE